MVGSDYFSYPSVPIESFCLAVRREGFGCEDAREVAITNSIKMYFDSLVGYEGKG